jgi:hypothetical protein
MRRYAETRSDRWFILSAKHGLIEPDHLVEPYEQSLLTMSAHERREWSRGVVSSLLAVLPREASIVLLAGQRYREQLEPFLIEQGYVVEVPLRGLSIGQQLQWLKRANG